MPDLLGLPVVTDTGEAVGTVAAIENFGATDIIEITRDPVPEKGPQDLHGADDPRRCAGVGRTPACHRRGLRRRLRA